MWTCNKCGEKIEDQFDSCWKCAGEPDHIGLPLVVRLKASQRQIVRGVLLASGLIPATWLCFGPVAGFHHMHGFGVTFYLMLNGEDPQPGEPMWGEYAVRFFPTRFAVGLVLWFISVFVVFKVVRFLSKRWFVALA
jgi:hypothetical protein